MLPDIYKLFGKKSNTWNQSTHLRCVCISDTHTKHKSLQLPPGDVLIHAGDFTFGGSPSEIQDFNSWLGGLNFEHKVVIAGNHEISFDLEREEFLKPRFFSP